MNDRDRTEETTPSSGPFPSPSDGVEKKVDDEWKRTARLEKERFFTEEPEPDRGSRMPEASLVFLVSSIYQQAVASLSGALHGGPSARQELAHAKLNIDLLQVIQKKTEGNRTVEETQTLAEVLRDLQTKFVQLSGRVR